MRPAKIQISLRICAVWSESSLDAFWIAILRLQGFFLQTTRTVIRLMRSLIWVFAHVRRYFFSRYVLFVRFLILLGTTQCRRQTKPFRVSGWQIVVKVCSTADLYHYLSPTTAGLGGSVGCAVRLETRRSRVQPPPRSATFFRGDWSWNIFYGHSLPSADSRRAVVSFWRKNVHNTG